MAKNFIYNEKEAKKIFFTSDTHFHHANIIKYCNRPFESVEKHDEELIRRWNSKVPSDGIVFHLGDVGFGKPTIIYDIINRLNGKIYLVIGNHDWRRIVQENAERFELMTQQINMKVDNQHIILNHYPFLCYSGVYHEVPSWQLFGHVHTSPYSSNGLDNSRLVNLYPTQYDVGVDNNDFTPINYYELKDIIEKQLSMNPIKKELPE